MTKKLKFFGADLESTGLLPDLRKQGDKARLHNFGLISITQDKHMILHPMEPEHREKLQAILNRTDTVLVMHNGICYDMEALKLFGFDTSKVKIVDTLYLAWYVDFFKSNPRYGLEQYGVELGFPKPPIDDWENLTQEDYDNRVYGDIQIQKKLWLKLCKQFAELYGIPQDDMMETNVYNHHCMKYLMWKGEQLRQQQENRWKFDVEKAEPLLVKIEKELKEKLVNLKEVMPKVPIYKTTKRPKKMFKANGELSAIGEKWAELCKEHKLGINDAEEIRYVSGYSEPNPASPQQVKDWLYELGWVPETYEFKKDENGERKIPQVYVKNTGGQVCPSVERLAEEVEEVSHLVGMGVLKHRKGMVKNWLENHDEGYLTARAQGFTNTLRLKHAELVNLPSGRVLLGSEIRGLLGVRNHNHILLGSDLSSLENRLKFHFQLPLDPDYVHAQMSDDFDPHLAIAEMAGLVTQDEVNFYKVVKEGFDPSRYHTEVLETMLSWDESVQASEVKRIAKVRSAGKQANYACVSTEYKVSTPQGYKLWSELGVGDEVWGSDEYGRRIRTKIEAVHFYEDADVLEVKMGGESVLSTWNHRWMKSAGFGEYVITQTIVKDIESGHRTSLVLSPVMMGCVGVYRSVSDGFEYLGEAKSDVFCLTTESGNFEMVMPSGDLMLTGNCQYGAGAKTVARSAKVALEVGKQLVDGYRELNWSIDVIASQTMVKKTSFGDFQMNPINKMFYPLKTAKDRFSTLIQGSGSYVLDLWLMFCEKRINQAMSAGLLKVRPMLLGQFHDEQIQELHVDDQDLVKSIINDAITDCNKAMKLRVDLGCDIQFGKTYADIH